MPFVKLLKVVLVNFLAKILSEELYNEEKGK